jgi:hypothetical protein
LFLNYETTKSLGLLYMLGCPVAFHLPGDYGQVGEPVIDAQSQTSGHNFFFFWSCFALETADLGKIHVRWFSRTMNRFPCTLATKRGG